MLEERNGSMGTNLDSEVTAQCLIIQEVGSNHIPELAQSQHEVREAKGGVCLHDVPKDGLPADGEHRLRSEFPGLPDPCALAATENDRGNSGTLAF